MTQQIYAGTIKEWRGWLRKNHKKETKVDLIIYKKHTGKPTLSHLEQMKEAICFGWIDTTLKRLDDEKYRRTFMKRTSKSRWSNNTIRYAEEQIKKGRMSKFGMEMYLLGKSKPTIDHNLPKNPEAPEDLKKALGKHITTSTKRLFIYQVIKSKRPETRQKWIQWVVDKVKENKKPYE